MAIYFKTRNAQRAKRAPSPFQRLADDPNPIGSGRPVASTGPAAAIEEGYGTGDTGAVAIPGGGVSWPWCQGTLVPAAVRSRRLARPLSCATAGDVGDMHARCT